LKSMSTSDKFVSFFNDGDFIRVTDTQQNTTVYFNKANMSVQMDNNQSFYIKNDSNIGFYNFVNVSYPNSATIKELVYKLVEWAKFRVETWDLSKCVSLMELQMNVDNNPLEVDQLTNTGSTNVYDQTSQLVRMNVTTPTSKSVRQSKMYLNYRLGQDTLAVISGTLVEAERNVGGTNIIARNLISRIGLYEDKDDIVTGKNYTTPGRAGFFFQYETKSVTTGTTTTNTDEVSVVLRRDGQPDLVISQANWNIDRLNGQGASVLNVDFKKSMTYVFEMRNRQGTAMRLGVMYNDLIVFCHEFSDSLFGNSLTSDCMPSLPLRWEIRGNGTTGATSTGSMLQGYAIVYAKQDRTNNDIRVFGTNSKQKLLTANEQNKNLIALSLLSNRIRCRVQITKVQVINTQTGFARWELILGPGRSDNGTIIPILTDATFASVGQSVVRRNDSDDTINTGTILATGFIGSNSIETIDLDDQFASLMARINGTPDTVAIRISGMFGTTNVAVAVSWREYI